jgi:hypothetical protein
VLVPVGTGGTPVSGVILLLREGISEQEVHGPALPTGDPPGGKLEML